MAEEQKPSSSRKRYVLDEATRFQRKIEVLTRLLKNNHGKKDPDGPSSKPKRKDSRISYCDTSTDDGGSTDEESKGKKKVRGKKGKKIAEKRKWKGAMTFEDWIRITPETFDEEDGINYFTAQAPPSKYPEKHYCNVCGFKAPYTCVECGIRFCSVKCFKIHKDTRCLKHVI